MCHPKGSERFFFTCAPQPQLFFSKWLWPIELLSFLCNCWAANSLIRQNKINMAICFPKHEKSGVYVNSFKRWRTWPNYSSMYTFMPFWHFECLSSALFFSFSSHLLMSCGHYYCVYSLYPDLLEVLFLIIGWQQVSNPHSQLHPLHPLP